MRVGRKSTLIVVLIFSISLFIFVTQVRAEGSAEKENQSMDYFPRSVGSNWVYAGVGKEGNTNEFKTTIIGTENIKGINCFAIENKINGGMYEIFYLDDGLGVINILKRVQPTSEGSYETYNFDPPVLVFLTSPSAIGKSQTSISTVKTYEGEAMQEKGSSSLIVFTETVGMEKVETPAGVFDQCIKFKWESMSDKGEEIVRYIWLAPEVGPVKLILDDIEFKLTSYSISKRE